MFGVASALLIGDGGGPATLMPNYEPIPNPKLWRQWWTIDKRVGACFSVSMQLY